MPAAMRPSGAPRAPTRGTRFVPDLSDEAPNLGLRIADLERQLLEQKDAAEEARAAERNAKARRQGEANRASKLEEEKKTLEVAVEKLQKQLAEGPTRKKKAVNSAQTFSDRVTELSKHVKRLYELDDLPRLFVDCLRRLSKGRTDLRPLLRKAPGFEAVLREIHLERDRSTAEHLRRNVYNKEAFALLRLIVFVVGLAAARAVRAAAFGVADVAGVDVTQALVQRDAPGHRQGLRRRARNLAHAVVGVEGGEMQRHVGAEVFMHPARQGLDLVGAVDVYRNRCDVIQVVHRDAVAAQARRGEINGVDRIWYAGAYWGWGFHEDGIRSAVDVVRALGVHWPQ